MWKGDEAMHKKRAFFAIALCLALCVVSLSYAGERPQGPARGAAPDPAPVVSGERGDSDLAPASVHRFLRARLQLRLLRLALELRQPAAPPPVNTNGLSDDPDPTGWGGEETEDEPDEDDYQGGADDSTGSSGSNAGMDSVRPS